MNLVNDQSQGLREVIEGLAAMADHILMSRNPTSADDTVHWVVMMIAKHARRQVSQLDARCVDEFFALRKQLDLASRTSIDTLQAPEHRDMIAQIDRVLDAAAAMGIAPARLPEPVCAVAPVAATSEGRHHVLERVEALLARLHIDTDDGDGARTAGTTSPLAILPGLLGPTLKFLHQMLVLPGELDPSAVAYHIAALRTVGRLRPPDGEAAKDIGPDRLPHLIRLLDEVQTIVSEIITGLDGLLEHRTYRPNRESARPEITYLWDVFVSYAAVNNKMGKPYQRWVSEFVKLLRSELAQPTGEEKRVYFDEANLEISDRFEAVIEACSSSKIFVPICSRAYFKRGWTRKELEAFASQAGGTDRIFPVVLEVVPDAERYGELRAHNGLPFHVETVIGGKTVTMPIGPSRKAFVASVRVLSQRIDECLKLLEQA